MMEDQSVTLFREFLLIRTDHPTPDYVGAVQFLSKIATDIGLKCQFTSETGNPILIATWQGRNPALPSLLLNAHMDVVPVIPDKWTNDAFGAHKDEKGNIYGRGTQDMKSVAVQYLLAIGELRRQGKQPLRDVHVMYVPDEEIGGTTGMAAFVHSKLFASLHVGFTLDEGLANPTNKFTVFYAERAPHWVMIKSTGPTGHGSRFIEDTAVEKLMKTVQKMLSFREEQFQKLKHNCQCGMKLGDVITLNLTVLKAGVTKDGGQTFSVNVIPIEAEAGFDIRVPPTETENVNRLLAEWVTDQGLELVVINPPIKNVLTPLTNENVWWNAFQRATTKLGLELETEIFPAATDSRFIRAVGIPALGFSPINNTPILLHDHNEFLNEKVFLDGIPIYCEIISELANVPE